MKRTYTLLYICVMLMTLSSCEYKDFYDDMLRKVQINFDWSKVSQSPSSMRVLFYPRSGFPIVQDFPSYGGTVTLPADEYSVVSFNTDTQHNIVDGTETQQTLYMTSPVILLNGEIPVTRTSKDTAMVIPAILSDYPDWFCRSYGDTLRINPNASNSIKLTPDTACYEVDITVRGVKGLSYVRESRMILTGVAGHCSLGTGKAAQDTTNVYFNATMTEDTLLKSHFYIYDTDVTSGCQPKKLVMLFWLDFGTTAHTVDITDAIRREKNKGTRHLIIDLDVDFTASEGIITDGTFLIHIEDWEDDRREMGL